MVFLQVSFYKTEEGDLKVKLSDEEKRKNERFMRVLKGAAGLKEDK